MTILGLGIDIVELVRIERLLARHEKRFLERICRSGEWQRRDAEAFVQHVGGLFAAKEAVLKALGTGWAQGLAPRQVEILRAENGAPSVRLHDGATVRASELGVREVHLSVTHERSYAAAVAILECPGYDRGCP
jgi:holo-[acyl-carrier protein] synthase